MWWIKNTLRKEEESFDKINYIEDWKANNGDIYIFKFTFNLDKQTNQKEIQVMIQ